MGTDFRFIHCADLHLGSGFKGLSKIDSELGKRMTESIFESFKNIIDIAINENVDFIVISGDTFDEENETPKTRYKFIQELSRLRIPCFIALGNHDYKRSWESSIPYPENVHVFSSKPEQLTINVNGENICLAGRSFAIRNTSEDLAGSLIGSPDMFSIGVVHCSIDAVSEDEDYAPCKVSTLLNKNIDYWALGHIHKRTEVHEYPHIVYPGNIQGRNSKESGNKGMYLVSVSNKRVSDLKFIPTQTIIWQDIVVDIKDRTLDSLINCVKTKLENNSIVSLKLTGRGDLNRIIRLHPEDVIDAVSNITRLPATLEIDTAPILDLDSLKEGNDIFSMIIKISEEIENNENLADLICDTKLSSEYKQFFENMNDEEKISLLNDAKLLLIEKLQEESR